LPANSRSLPESQQEAIEDLILPFFNASHQVATVRSHDIKEFPRRWLIWVICGEQTDGTQEKETNLQVTKAPSRWPQVGYDAGQQM
jgi:hypothetical protein